MTTGSPTLVVTSLTSTTYADGSSATACAPALTTRPVSTKTRNTAVAAVRARNMKAIRERNDGGMQRPAANTGGWLRETNEGLGATGGVHLETANTQMTPPCGTSAFQPTSSAIRLCWNAGSTP